MLTLSSTAWSTMPTASISTARACGEPVNPPGRPEPVALWTCRCAWTTRTALSTCPQQQQQKTNPSSRDSRLTTRLGRCQKPDSQNASRPGRHQIGMVGEIISESWARSYRYTRARSSESAPTPFDHVLGDARLGDFKPQLEQFAVNAWRAPKWVLDTHPPDQRTELRHDW